jgi:hypothetical protein
MNAYYGEVGKKKRAARQVALFCFLRQPPGGVFDFVRVPAECDAREVFLKLSKRLEGLS